MEFDRGEIFLRHKFSLNLYLFITKVYINVIIVLLKKSAMPGKGEEKRPSQSQKTKTQNYPTPHINKNHPPSHAIGVIFVMASPFSRKLILPRKGNPLGSPGLGVKSV
jgi:hypothetical protein